MTIESYDVLEVALKNQLARFLEECLLVLVDVVETVDCRRAQPRDHSAFYKCVLKATATTEIRQNGRAQVPFCQLQTTV